MIDYTIFYKTSFEDGNVDCGVVYDYFFSGYDDCERTKTVFDKINSKQKIWIDFPHYKLDLSGISGVYKCESYSEDDCFIDLFDQLKIDPSSSICIDITGFIRPHLMFFTVYLSRIGVKKIDFLYSEPVHYSNAEDTAFSGFIDEVKTIEGCSAKYNNPSSDDDLLIITAGYDDKLIAKVSQYKSKIKKKYYILGLPSLQPDMYQESVLQIYNAKDSIGNIEQRFAPANDPFVTADVVSDIVNSAGTYSNIYLSPLSTKPQALGIVLYYLWNYQTKPINIVFPYSKSYFVKTAIGIKRTWKYTFELP
jgi:hypothetical protein